MDWLVSLDNIEANFGNLCLKWQLDGKQYVEHYVDDFV
jgi:hypothetical protein